MILLTRVFITVRLSSTNFVAEFPDFLLQSVVLNKFMFCLKITVVVCVFVFFLLFCLMVRYLLRSYTRTQYTFFFLFNMIFFNQYFCSFLLLPGAA